MHAKSKGPANLALPPSAPTAELVTGEFTVDGRDAVGMRRHILARLDRLDETGLRRLIDELDLILDENTVNIDEESIGTGADMLCRLINSIENGIDSISSRSNVDFVEGAHCESDGIEIFIEPLDKSSVRTILVRDNSQEVLRLSYSGGGAFGEDISRVQSSGDSNQYGQVILQALIQPNLWQQLSTNLPTL